MSNQPSLDKRRQGGKAAITLATLVGYPYRDRKASAPPRIEKQNHGSDALLRLAGTQVPLQVLPMLQLWELLVEHTVGPLSLEQLGVQGIALLDCLLVDGETSTDP